MCIGTSLAHFEIHPPWRRRQGCASTTTRTTEDGGPVAVLRGWYLIVVVVETGDGWSRLDRRGRAPGGQNRGRGGQCPDDLVVVVVGMIRHRRRQYLGPEMGTK